jgi:hypothetical protein
MATADEKVSMLEAFTDLFTDFHTTKDFHTHDLQPPYESKASVRTEAFRWIRVL